MRSALTRLASRALASSSASTSAAAAGAAGAAAAAATTPYRWLHASPPAAQSAAKATTGIVGLAVDPAARETAMTKLRAVADALDAAGVPADAQYRKGVEGLVAQRCVFVWGVVGCAGRAIACGGT
jgi:hypothetical protein